MVPTGMVPVPATPPWNSPGARPATPTTGGSADSDTGPPAGSLEDLLERLVDVEGQIGRFPQQLAQRIGQSEARVHELAERIEQSEKKIQSLQAEVDYMQTWAGWLS